MKKLSDKVSAFLKSRRGILMMLAAQIFIMKTMRAHTLLITVSALILTAHIIRAHTGACPLKDLHLCQYFTGK